MNVRFAVIVVIGLLAPGAPARAASATGSNPVRDQACVNDPSWVQAQTPFRIHGNTWYVGPHGLGVFLITSAKGDVLIDGGVPEDAPMIEANIRRLGFDPHDVKWILNSHAHCDHAGGIAQLAHDTGAQVIAGAADAALLARGGRDDPQYGDRFPFPPVHVTRKVHDGERLQLGDIVLTAHATPGHTKGNTTWSWMSCEHKHCKTMVDVGSLSAPGYHLLRNPKYPDQIADYERSFAKVAALPCDIALAPHPGMVDFWKRVAERDAGHPDALVDNTLCRAYADDARKEFEKELQKQRVVAAPATPAPQQP